MIVSRTRVHTDSKLWQNLFVNTDTFIVSFRRLARHTHRKWIDWQRTKRRGGGRGRGNNVLWFTIERTLLMFLFIPTSSRYAFEHACKYELYWRYTRRWLSKDVNLWRLEKKNLFFSAWNENFPIRVAFLPAALMRRYDTNYISIWHGEPHTVSTRITLPAKTTSSWMTWVRGMIHKHFNANSSNESCFFDGKQNLIARYF